MLQEKGEKCRIEIRRERDTKNLGSNCNNIKPPCKKNYLKYAYKYRCASIQPEYPYTHVGPYQAKIKKIVQKNPATLLNTTCSEVGMYLKLSKDKAGHTL
mmetsp:Transcript_15498/g.39238  ORF Transcript_15498/g.39238 Transcript_15498/m.39238 type:complete len:100 (+) Transcript_15498:1509-1808(+)